MPRGHVIPSDVVLAIRTRYADEGLTCRQLAAEYGLNHNYVFKIVNGLVRRDVGGPISVADMRTTRSGRKKKTPAPQEAAE